MRTVELKRTKLKHSKMLLNEHCINISRFLQCNECIKLVDVINARGHHNLAERFKRTYKDMLHKGLSR